jgi:hypothetical protein
MPLGGECRGMRAKKSALTQGYVPVAPGVCLGGTSEASIHSAPDQAEHRVRGRSASIAP